jgi:peptidyl-prolyl cis-trans isomerase A (cyclophilin A)
MLDSTAFFRVIPGYIAQFGINGSPRISSAWQYRVFPDDTTQHQSNLRGRVSFASSGPNSRTTQLFINLRDNPNLDEHYPPIGEVVEGAQVIDSLYAAYGDGPPMGRGPDQNRIYQEGNAYLSRDYPKLDYIKTARIVR